LADCFSKCRDDRPLQRPDMEQLMKHKNIFLIISSKFDWIINILGAGFVSWLSKRILFLSFPQGCLYLLEALEDDSG